MAFRGASSWCRHQGVRSDGDDLGGRRMPKYLLQVNYTLDGVKGVLSKGGSARRTAAEAAAVSAGGSLESLYFAFGSTDVFAVADLPDNAAAGSIGAHRERGRRRHGEHHRAADGGGDRSRHSEQRRLHRTRPVAAATPSWPWPRCPASLAARTANPRGRTDSEDASRSRHGIGRC